ncbi:MAG TPA: hypothetical protein VFZ12_05065, partial [Dehalococcoidia bacterium]|nr:hypothetical protein [Dehalococcoidia bacterium]
METWRRLFLGGIGALAAVASVSLFNGQAEAGTDCELLNDPLCVLDGPGGGGNGGGGGGSGNEDDNDIDLGLDLDNDGNNEVEAEIDIFGDVDADVDVDLDGDGESAGSDESNDVEADLNTVTDAAGRVTGSLGDGDGAATADEALVLLDAVVDAVLITNTDLDAEINPILSDDIVVLRLCHMNSLDGTQLAFLDAAGNIVDVVANETELTTVYVGINTDAPCDSAGPLSDGGDDGLIDRDIVVVGVCHASEADSSQFGFVDLAGNTIDLVAEEFAVNDVLVAVNTDRPCPGDEGEGAGPALIDDDIAAVAICHLSGLEGAQTVLIDELGNEISVLAEEVAANEILVAINNGGLCPNDSDGAGDEDDDLIDGNLIVVGVCHISELGTETLAFIDLAGNPVDIANETFNTNDVLVLINTDSICPTGDTPPDDDDDDDGSDDDDEGDLITVGICLLTDVASNTSILTQIAGTPAEADQQLAALGDLVLAVNRVDPCPTEVGGGDDDDDDGDDDDGDDDDDETPDGGDDDDTGNGGDDDDETTATTSDDNDLFGEFEGLRSGQGSGSGDPSINTGGFGLVTNA